MQYLLWILSLNGIFLRFFLFVVCTSNSFLVLPRCVLLHVKVKVTQLCLTLCDPMNYIVQGILQARILKWVAFPCSRGSSQPRDRTQVSCVAADSLPAEPQGKPNDTGVGSLSLLQQIFLTQESNWGLLHCRWILYQIWANSGRQWRIEKTGVPQAKGLKRVEHDLATNEEMVGYLY